MKIYRVVPGANWGRGPVPSDWGGYSRTCVDNACPTQEWHDQSALAEIEARRISQIYDHRQPGYQRDDPLPVHVFACHVDSILAALRGEVHGHELRCVFMGGERLSADEFYALEAQSV